MPIIRSAKKKLRSDNRKEVINKAVKTKVKTALKKFKAAPANKTLGEAYSMLDVAAKKGIIPKRRSDRKKSRLATILSKKVGQKTGHKPKATRTAEK